jgi:hypothetical protein
MTTVRDRVDRGPVGVDLDAEVDAVVVTGGGEVTGGRGVGGDFLQAGLQRGEPGFDIGRVGHAEQRTDKVAAPVPADPPIGTGLAAAMTTALVARGVPDPSAHLAGELGVLAFKWGYAEWSGDDRAADELAPYTLRALDELRAASASLG